MLEMKSAYSTKPAHFLVFVIKNAFSYICLQQSRAGQLSDDDLCMRIREQHTGLV